MNWATSPLFQTWAIAGLATAGVILRPFRLNEAIWAVAGAALLVVAGLLPAASAWDGVKKGTDVYLFLTGMMLLSEIARREGLFDFLAAEAAIHAKGSATRLFLLVYLVGVLVTVFLSNDATAVVLTPAVFAATQAARIEKPLPYLYLCAFVANAASFVLPISNPANLVLYGRSGLPPLFEWLRIFALPSLAAIVVTYAALRFALRRDLAAPVSEPGHRPELTFCGKLAAAGIGVTALALLYASARGLDLGAPTLASGLATTVLVLLVRRCGPLPLARDISWGVLPLVAGLFVLVEALDKTGVTAQIATLLRETSAPVSGATLAFATNLVNNLPAGLVAASAAQQASFSPDGAASLLIGVDLGPNLSVTGSLATILWLAVLRREKQSVRDRDFLVLGLVAMPLALVAALAAALI